MRRTAGAWEKLSALAGALASLGSSTGDDPGSAGSQAGATGVELEGVSVLLDPPLRRLVPRDVLAPPEGWEVPQALPPRPARCELDDRPAPAP